MSHEQGDESPTSKKSLPYPKTITSLSTLWNQRPVPRASASSSLGGMTDHGLGIDRRDYCENRRDLLNADRLFQQDITEEMPCLNASTGQKDTKADAVCLKCCLSLRLPKGRPVRRFGTHERRA